MRLGIVSDIHGNIDALDTALAAMSDQVDELLCAGDAFSDHRFSNEVVSRLREAGARYVLGNHEMNLLSPAGVNARTSSRVDPGELEFVADQPLQMRVAIGSKTLLMVHGSAWEPYGEYLTRSHRKYLRCDELEADFLITGHTHTAFHARFGRTLVVNPGSLGNSDDPDRRTTVTFAMLDTDSEEVTVGEFGNPRLVG